MDNVSRRNLFHILGTAPAAAAFLSTQALAAEDHGSHPTRPPALGKFERRTFDDRQWRTVHVLADLIIPADERSVSATAAGVPEFIDDWLIWRTQNDNHDRLRSEIFGGLAWLDRESNEQFGKDFADATEDQQKKIIDRVAWPAKAAKEDKIWAAFFSEFRDLTVSGFFSSKIGVADLPYLGNTVVTNWVGCDPKVWAVIENRMKNGYTGLVNPPAQRG